MVAARARVFCSSQNCTVLSSWMRRSSSWGLVVGASQGPSGWVLALCGTAVPKGEAAKDDAAKGGATKGGVKALVKGF